MCHSYLKIGFPLLVVRHTSFSCLSDATLRLSIERDLTHSIGVAWVPNAILFLVLVTGHDAWVSNAIRRKVHVMLEFWTRSDVKYRGWGETRSSPLKIIFPLLLRSAFLSWYRGALLFLVLVTQCDACVFWTQSDVNYMQRLSIERNPT